MAAQSEPKKRRSFLGVLILILVVFIAGGVVGRLPIGRQAESLFQSMRYARTPAAAAFLANPFGLSIHYRQNENGELETYLLNAATNEMLPIYGINGTTQVGKAEHRMIGLKDQLVREAQTGGSAAVEKAKQLLDFLDR
jgi:hypothetical protein